jgi:two-component system CheB/CheR fusion protein
VMSHELRHPLNLISINAELLARLPAVRASAPALRSAAIIRAAVSSQSKIIEDLMDMSRASTGKLSLALQDIDLVATTAKIVDMMRADPIVNDLTLTFTPHARPVVVAADAVRIEQVILNLLSNAIKFTPQGGKVTVDVSIENDEARVDVNDSGIGIAPESLPFVFDMFGQGAATALRSKAGLGIGLALVHQIIALHGGRVAALSAGAAQGSTFTLWLPLSHVQLGLGGGAPEANLASIAGLRLLLVDDSEETTFLLKILLEHEGALVATAESGQLGLDQLAVAQFDAIISDVSMPHMSGYEFVRAVRTMPGLRNLPVIAASGLGREQNKLSAEEAGFSAWFTKPIRIETLCSSIAVLCAGQAVTAR